MAAIIESWFEQDLKKPVQVQVLNGNVFSQDHNGNLVGVKVYDGGEPATLTGSVNAYCILPDGTTVPVDGTRQDNTAYFMVPQSALAVPGTIRIVIKLTETDANDDVTNVTTLAAILSTVYRSKTDTVITPSSQVISDWSQAIAAEIQNCADARTSLGGIIAAEYSTTKTYAVGEYVMKSGTLYRCTTAVTTAGAWSTNSSKFTEVKLGPDVSDLKSAMRIEQKGTRQIVAGDIVDGGVSTSTPLVPTSSSNRIRTTGLIPVYNGMIISFTPGTNAARMMCYKFYENLQPTSDSFAWNTTAKEIVVDFDGYVAFCFRNNGENGGTEIHSSDYDAQIFLYSKTRSDFNGEVKSNPVYDLSYASGIINYQGNIETNNKWIRSANNSVKAKTIQHGDAYFVSAEYVANVHIYTSNSFSNSTWVDKIYSRVNGYIPIPDGYIGKYAAIAVQKIGHENDDISADLETIKEKILYLCPSMKLDEEIVAKRYVDLTFPVAAGTHCMNNGKYYRAKQDITTREDFDASKWTRRTVGGEINDIEEETAEHIRMAGLTLPLDILSDRRYVSRTSQTVNYSWDEERTKLNVSGTASPSNSTYNLSATISTAVTPGEKLYVMVTFTGSNISFDIVTYDSNKENAKAIASFNKTGIYTVTIPQNAYYIHARAKVKAGDTASGTVEGYVTRNAPNGVIPVPIVSSENPLGLHVIPESTGVLNVIRRARQMTDIKWTPGATISRGFYPTSDTRAGGPRYIGQFTAGTEYTGVPYSMNLHNEVGTDIGLDTFATSAAEPRSIMALVKPAPQDNPEKVDEQVYYGTICSNLTSYALNLPLIESEYYPDIPGLELISPVNGLNLDDIKLADILQKNGHCAMITDIIYDDLGNVTMIEVSEATLYGNSNIQHRNGQYGGKSRRYMLTVEGFFTQYIEFNVMRYAYLDNIPYIPNPYAPMVDEGSPLAYTDFPCVPYLGNKCSVSRNDDEWKVKILLNNSVHTHMVVEKNGTAWNENGTTDPYDISGLDNITVNCDRDYGVYKAYLIQVADNEIKRKTISCTWVVRPSQTITATVSGDTVNITTTVSGTLFKPWAVTFGDTAAASLANRGQYNTFYKVWDSYTVTDNGNGTYTYSFSVPYPESHNANVRVFIRSEEYGVGSTGKDL